MAASGFTPISLYYSPTTTHTPSAGNLAYGELAINIADGILFYKDNTGAVRTINSGATGGGNDKIFIENGQTVTTSYTIPSTINAMSTGPITINSGITVTVPSGSRWVVL